MAIYTYQSTAGNREDLLDVIQMISPEETPLWSRLRKVSATATLHEWVTDTLATATANAAVEGASAAYGQTTSKSRVNNYTQILTKSWEITGTQEKVSKVGIGSEYAYQLEKAMKEWAIDAENVLILSSSASGTSGTARTMTGIQQSISTNVLTGTSSTAITETLYNDHLQTIFSAGGNPDLTVANGFNKRRISQFATPNTRYLMVPTSGGARVTNTVAIYESDFGVQEILLDRYVPVRLILILTEEKNRIAMLRNPFSEELAKVGDSRRGQIVGEWTYEYLMQNGNGKITAFASSTT